MAMGSRHHSTTSMFHPKALAQSRSRKIGYITIQYRLTGSPRKEGTFASTILLVTPASINLVTSATGEETTSFGAERGMGTFC